MRVSRPTKKNSRVFCKLLHPQHRLRRYRLIRKDSQRETACGSTRMLSRLLWILLHQNQHRIRWHHLLARKVHVRDNTRQNRNSHLRTTSKHGDGNILLARDTMVTEEAARRHLSCQRLSWCQNGHHHSLKSRTSTLTSQQPHRLARLTRRD